MKAKPATDGAGAILDGAPTGRNTEDISASAAAVGTH